MLIKVFNILAIFSIFSVVCIFVTLLYREDNPFTFFEKQYNEANGNDTVSKMIRDRVDELVALEAEESAAGEQTTPTPKRIPDAANKTLPPCPDLSPNLIGPLHVEFNYQMSLDEVRQAVSAPLQEGGRYKPPDCISKQKVGV